MNFLLIVYVHPALPSFCRIFDGTGCPLELKQKTRKREGSLQASFFPHAGSQTFEIPIFSSGRSKSENLFFSRPAGSNRLGFTTIFFITHSPEIANR
jgi:hypothetical protein